MTETILIAAVAEDGTIGVDNEIPWDYPSDMDFFAEKTTGHTVVMGRKTYENVGKLPDRHNIVMSKSKSYDDVTVCKTLSEVTEEVRWMDEDKVFIAGGESIYEQFSDIADKLLVTQIPGYYKGDSKFPMLDPSAWKYSDSHIIGESKLVVSEYERNAVDDQKNRFYL